jgi:thioredoxin-related protein
MKKIIPSLQALLILVAFTFSGCNEANPTAENQVSSPQAEVSEATDVANIEPNSNDAPAAEQEAIDESLVDAESPQDDFTNEISEPNPAPDSTQSSGKPVNGLKKIFNFQEALQLAQKNGKPILLEFTGSDWCPPCMMMQKEIFSTEEFIRFSNDNLNFVYLDFPRGKEIDPKQEQHNNELAETYKIQGFPTVILLSSQGKELGRIEEYLPGGPTAIINWIQKTKAH